jgi:hypothetical protein
MDAGKTCGGAREAHSAGKPLARAQQYAYKNIGFHINLAKRLNAGGRYVARFGNEEQCRKLLPGDAG